MRHKINPPGGNIEPTEHAPTKAAFSENDFRQTKRMKNKEVHFRYVIDIAGAMPKEA